MLFRAQQSAEIASAINMSQSFPMWNNVRPGTFGKIKVRSRGYPKSPSVKNVKFAVTPFVPTPFMYTIIYMCIYTYMHIMYMYIL